MKNTSLKPVDSSNKIVRILSLFLLLFSALTLLSGCEVFSPSPRPTPNPKPVPDKPNEPDKEESLIKTSEYNIYFVRGEKLGVAKRTLPSEGTLEVRGSVLVTELLKGTDAIETEFGLLTTIPAGTKLLGVTVKGTEATVNLSSEFESGGGSLSMLLRIAQMVWTLTEVDGIESVSFALNGKAVESIGGEGIMVSPALTRASCEDQVPAILVQSPAINQEVKSPLLVSGSSNTFEAMLMVDIVDPEGLILKTVPIMATSGTGTRGTFEMSIPFETTRSGIGEIIFYEASAKDGKPINIVEIPVRMAP